jgi:DNA-binding response OmpR family regulator
MQLAHMEMPRPKPPTILIVDDDEVVTDHFAKTLRMEGYEVRTAVDGEAGLLEATAGHPDAIILDLRMRLLNGVEFLRRLRDQADLQETPVAIVTGDYFLDDEVMEELRVLRADLRYKPLWIEDLVELTGQLLNVKH